MSTNPVLNHIVCYGTTLTAVFARHSINNFDTVNDTGSECHGFEIELEDCHSTDITYTYNYNHYGVPRDRPRTTPPQAHPRSAASAGRAPATPDGTWAAYTAIPSGPIAPTDGHRFTDPSVNFGGEHFGVGYTVQPSAVIYHWLMDDGAGTLVRGGAVQVSTPTFTYYPPVPGDLAPAQVQAEIVPPEPPEPPTREFGPAVWVKEIRTTTHNNREVKLRDLVSDDPDDPDDKSTGATASRTRSRRNGKFSRRTTTRPTAARTANWPPRRRTWTNGRRGGHPPLRVLQVHRPARRRDRRGHGRRGRPGRHSRRTVKTDINGVEVDLSTVEVVGEYTGAQMAAVDVDAPVGLIDHVGGWRTRHPLRRADGGGRRAAALHGCEAGRRCRPGWTFRRGHRHPVRHPDGSGEFVFKVTAATA